MNENWLTPPPGKSMGCLPRRSKPGTLAPFLRDRVSVIPRAEWDDILAGRADRQAQLNGRMDVQKIKDQDGIGCHDEKTEVLTDEGWKLWTNYDGKAALGTVNPVSHNLEFQYPTEIHAYDYDGPMHTIENRAVNLSLTPNHRMLVRPWNERKRTLDDCYVIRTMDSLGWYVGLMTAPSGFNGPDINSVSLGRLTCSGDDFVSLVSLVASDGWVGGSESTWHRVSFCCFREDRQKMVRDIAGRLGFRELSNRPGVWEQRNPELANWFRANMFDGDVYRSPNKHVPSFIKDIGERQVELFLKFYGDQHVTGDRRVFFTSSPKMSDDLQELLLRIGKRGGISVRKPRSVTMKDGRRIEATNGHLEHTITEWTSSNLSIERRRTETEYYKGPVFCATVPNSLLITRRNGKVLISGNSCATESTSQAIEIVGVRCGFDWQELNPWSIYRVTSGGRDQGSNIDDNLEYAREVGVLPVSFFPRYDANGKIINRWNAKPPAGWEEVAAQHRIHEWWDMTTIDEVGTALLLGYPVVVGWSSHSEVLVDLLQDAKAMVANSWSTEWGDAGFHVEPLSKINWSYGAFAVRTVVNRGIA